MPVEYEVKETINSILCGAGEPEDIATNLCLYCMKTQIFNDGNKRASVIFANHFLISKGAGLLVIPEEKCFRIQEVACNVLRKQGRRQDSRIYKNVLH